MRHKSPTPEQLSGFLSVKAIAALYFPCYLTSRSQMKALQKKLNENSTLTQKLNDTAFKGNFIKTYRLFGQLRKTQRKSPNYYIYY